ncbi:MAG: hypothetical protein EOM25_10650 [Deltaproteobacteria bacterium]|nr:hypothetical protein [Deltaproteobacteria bacterium]
MRKIIIVGSAPGGAKQAKAWLRKNKGAAVCLINEEIAAWRGPADFAATLHPEKLPDWLVRATHVSPLQKSGRTKPAAPTTIWTRESITYHRAVGTSAHLAVIAAIQNGFDAVALAGATMDGPYAMARPIWERAKRDGEIEALTEVLTDGWLKGLIHG